MTAPDQPRGEQAPADHDGGQNQAGPPRERLSYEQARDQLTDVVRRLEGGGLTLEQSLELWERGEQLAAICSEWLEGARARLAAAMPEQNGTDSQAPF